MVEGDGTRLDGSSGMGSNKLALTHSLVGPVDEVDDGVKNTTRMMGDP